MTQELASDFAEANKHAVTTIAGLDDDIWQSITDAEGWPVGVTARHIALGHTQAVTWLRHALDGHRIDGVDRIDATNAQIAAAGVIATKEQVLTELQSRASDLEQILAELTDDDLNRPVQFGGRTIPLRLLANAAVTHVTEHTASIRNVQGGHDA